MKRKLAENESDNADLAIEIGCVVYFISLLVLFIIPVLIQIIFSTSISDYIRPKAYMLGYLLFSMILFIPGFRIIVSVINNMKLSNKTKFFTSLLLGGFFLSGTLFLFLECINESVTRQAEMGSIVFCYFVFLLVFAIYSSYKDLWIRSKKKEVSDPSLLDDNFKIN